MTGLILFSKQNGQAVSHHIAGRQRGKTMRLGLDIGGTKIEAVVIDNAGEIVFCERSATPKQSYGDFFQAVTEMIAKARQAVNQPLSLMRVK